MREKLFRGQNPRTKVWVYGDLVTNYPHNGEYGIRPPGKHVTRVSQETVGQYTGVKDKNNDLLFEGDVFEYIVKDSDDNEERYYFRIFSVSSENGCFRFIAMHVDASSKDILDPYFVPLLEFLPSNMTKQ